MSDNFYKNEQIYTFERLGERTWIKERDRKFAGATVTNPPVIQFEQPQTEIDALKNIIKCKDDIIAAQDILIWQLRQHTTELRTAIENFAGKFKS